jgi:hypothetical protein
LSSSASLGLLMRGRLVGPLTLARPRPLTPNAC